MESRKDVQHVYLVGAKSLGAYQVIRYTVSNDEFDNAGVIGKLSATLF